MVYLIDLGMRTRGHDITVEDGFFEDRMEHSWCMVRGTLGRINGIILDFRFHSHSRLLDHCPLWALFLTGEIKENLRGQK